MDALELIVSVLKSFLFFIFLSRVLTFENACFGAHSVGPKSCLLFFFFFVLFFVEVLTFENGCFGAHSVGPEVFFSFFFFSCHSVGPEAITAMEFWGDTNLQVPFYFSTFLLAITALEF
jgi:hypothetical protein